MTDVPNLQSAMGQVRVISNDAGRAVIEFEVAPHMCHSGGVAQGGFVCGWIDAAMAHASISRDPAMTPMSLDLNVSFFAPARASRMPSSNAAIDSSSESPPPSSRSTTFPSRATISS